MTSVLGISAFYHDSAAAIVVNGEIIAAAQEERFTRKKHDAGYPKHAIDYVLKEAGLKLSKVDHRSEERRVGKECRSRWSPYH